MFKASINMISLSQKTSLFSLDNTSFNNNFEALETSSTTVTVAFLELLERGFKSIINENHLNAANITHGGYLSALIDAGAGTAAHRASGNSPCVTISLDLKFIGASKVGDEITGYTKILKKTNTLVFLFCELRCKDKIITSASGVWKILKTKI